MRPTTAPTREDFGFPSAPASARHVSRPNTPARGRRGGIALFLAVLAGLSGGGAIPAGEAPAKTGEGGAEIGAGEEGASGPEPTMVNIKWEWKEKELARIEKAARKLKRGDDGFFAVVHDGGAEFAKRPMEIRTTVSARFAAEVDEYFLLFLKRFPDLFPNDVDIKTRYTIRLFVYRNQKEYAQGVRDYFAKYRVNHTPPPWSGGLHVPNFGAKGGAELLIATFVTPPPGTKDEDVDFNRDFHRGVLQHEGTHAMLSAMAPRRIIPIFLNEGSATYFEVWDLRVGEPTKAERAARVRRGYHLLAVAEKLKADPGFAPSLAGYLSMPHTTWGTGDVALNYGLAEAFVDFMLTDKKRRQQFREMVNTAFRDSGTTAAKNVKLLEPKAIARLEPLWHAHLRELAEVVDNTVVTKE